MSLVPGLPPEDREKLLQQDVSQRAQWMLQDVAAHEEIWGLEDANGWVVAKLAQPPLGGPAFALPLWSRQELAALESAGPGEQPRAMDLETLLEELLPEIAERNWAVLAFSVNNSGQTFLAADFSEQLALAWESLSED